MIAQMALPLLGGAPAVWNTCLVFFQTLLLAGYLYAHLLTTQLGIRRQMIVHAGVWLAAALFLPIAVGKEWIPSVESPLSGLFGLLFVSASLPFFVVSTSAPLLQSWFCQTADPTAEDPYWLYALSNAGSVIALVSYPFLIEPSLRLAEQSWAWALGYGVLAVLTALCAIMTWRASGTDKMTRGQHDRITEAAKSSSLVLSSRDPVGLSFSQRLRWILIAFIPSSLMLGVTAHITQDYGSFPFLWILPLGLYLLSFILSFSRLPAWVQQGMIALLPFAVLSLTILRLSEIALGLVWTIGLHLVAFFVVAMVCHGELARTRPAPAHLTEFYLLMSLGGVLGGLFNVLIAPLVFKSVLEYPVVLAAACVLLPAVDLEGANRWRRWLARIGLAALGLLAVGFLMLAGVLLWAALGDLGIFPFFRECLARLGRWIDCMVLDLSGMGRGAGIDLRIVKVLLATSVLAAGGWYVYRNTGDRLRRGLDLALALALGATASGVMLVRPMLVSTTVDPTQKVQNFLGSTVIACGLLGALCLSLRPRPIRFALGIMAIFLAGTFCEYVQWQVLHRDRSYFGILSVEYNARENSHRLYHGTTLHGKQSLDPEQQRTPLAYYHRSGPIGQLFEAYPRTKVMPQVAVIGLGAGALACYAEPAQKMVFYEIDPAVVRLARAAEYFTYLGAAEGRGATIEYVLGDARLKLAEAPDKAYGLTVVDAFSSDTIPRHLITREALELYLKKLADGGLLAFHITNRHADLGPVLHALVRDARLHGLTQSDGDDDRIGKTASTWVLLAKEPRHYAPLLERYRRHWSLLQGRPDVGIWTDDFSNLLSVLR